MSVRQIPAREFSRGRRTILLLHGEKRYLTWEHIFMISNERPSPFKGLPQMQPRPPVHEETLKFEQVEIEHKNFVFTLKENLRGRFLRIT
jgi:hypothetical protein